MAKHRSPGEGTIFQENTNLWVAEITLPDGKRKRKRSKTQKIVRDWLLNQREAVKKGLWQDNEKITVGDFLDRYYTDVASHTLRAKTLVSYESIIRLHLKPEIGYLRLVALTPAHLQNLYAKKLDSGLSKRSVQYIHAVIHRVLTQAVKWGILVRNIADAVDAPKVNKKAPEVLTEAQVKQLLDSTTGRLKAIILIAATCGLRQGEILGLRWEDTDLNKSSIYISQTAQSIYKQGIIISEPKTERGKREVTLPEVTIETLKEYQLVTGDYKGLIFHTDTYKPVAARNVLRDYQALLDKGGLPHVTFHSLRHYHATALLQKNVNPKIVQERLGHSRISETLDIYSHVIPGMQQEAADKIDEIFKRSD
jgi:integrase